ncbi:MAG: inositol monophosphatase family protein [Smithellaceae bacterium]|nr:inositol monophosphatase family protein [Smithellaceae bacterium]
MESYRNFAVSLAREAGLLLKKRLHEIHTVDFKGEINIVTEADLMSEELILSRITARYPDHDILSEESPGTVKGSEYRWIIDPLDGTTNYAHGYPVFSVSIALEIGGEVCLGVVYNPMLGEMFVAEKGRGAFLNRRRLSVSIQDNLTRCLLATGFPYDIRTNKNNNIKYFNRLVLSCQAVRRAGSAALDIAYVAAGRFDGFWELKLMPWDMAAGMLLVREAGGMVTDMEGQPYSLTSPNVIASNGIIHREMLGLFREVDAL